MKYNVAALQIGASPSGTLATLEKIMKYESEIKELNIKLVACLKRL